MNKFKLVSLLVAFSTAIISCTEVDLGLGEEFIPDSEKMEFGESLFKDFKTYTLDVDSIPTSSWTTVMIGSLVSSKWGQTNYSAISTYLPYTGLNADSIWGVNPTVDSVKVVLYPIAYTGNNYDKKQVIAVHKLNKQIPNSSDSLYYSNFDKSLYVDPDKLATITVDGLGSFSAHLPVSFGEALLDTSGNRYLSDTLFIDKYPGLYFESEEFLSGGVVRTLDMTYSGVEVYYHNQNPVKADTLTAFFTFLNTTDVANLCITMIDHDYTLADPIIGVDKTIINNKDNNSGINYVLSQSGLMTRLEFNEDEFTELKRSVEEQGYKSISVTNATLRVPLNNPTPASMDTTLYRMATYIDYQNLYGTTDYELDINIQNDGGTSSYNGYLDRLNGEYIINITSQVQELLNGKNENYYVELAPELGASMTYRGAMLNSGDAELDITYIKMK